VDNRTADILRRINNDFYRRNGASFSATRKAPWPGWTRCLEVLRGELPLDGAPFLGGEPALRAESLPGGVSALADKSSPGGVFSVFDLACGNLRFEAFLASALSGMPVAMHAVDNCDSIVFPVPGVSYQSLDVLDVLLSGANLNDHITAPLCDLSVSFGFMHHVPLRACREELLASLIRQTRPGGHVIVSLWQFLNDARMAANARITHERALRELSELSELSELREAGELGAGELGDLSEPREADGPSGLGELGELGAGELGDLDENDYLLGWQDTPRAYRYCHSFSEDEIDRLVGSVAKTASVLSRFTADGRTGDLNTYLILKVH
jgi:SAM-dependent methyltransferase